MIRIGLPPPVLPRLRLHWHATHTLFARQTRSLREATAHATEALKEWLRHISHSMTAPWKRAAAARHKARLAPFEDHYEDLVDLLCWAAKDGIHTDRDTRYRDLRAWMQQHYPKLRPHLRPHWAEAETDACDPFEALFAAENVEDVIHAKAGIEHIMRTRCALDSYHETLENAARCP